MSSMKTGSGGMRTGERDERLANNQSGRAADRRLDDLERPSEGRIFGRSPIDRPVQAGTRSDSAAERENLKGAVSPPPLAK